MSNYVKQTRNPKTGLFEEAEWLDDYIAHHHYAVRFKDGSLYDPERANLETLEN